MEELNNLRQKTEAQEKELKNMKIFLDESAQYLSDWSKEEQYSDWFNQFNEFDGDDGFEIIDSSEIEAEQQQQQESTQEGGDDEEEPI